jgi:hypothetical protein
VIISIVGFALILVLFIWLVCETELAKRYLKLDSTSVWSYAAKLGGIIAFVRIAILWYATYREWTGTQSISMLLLLLFLLPEGAAIPRNWPPSAPHLLFSSGLLAVGGFGFGLLMAGLAKVSSFLRNNSK